MSWDYEMVDKQITNELYQQSVWLCPLCGAYRTPIDWHNFTSQKLPKRPCKFCGAQLNHGIVGFDGKTGFWYPKRHEVEDEWDLGVA